MSTIFCVVGEGDSITYASYGYFYKAICDCVPRDPREANRSYKNIPRVIATNFAVPGARISDAIARAAAVDALIPSSVAPSQAARKYIFCVLIGTNLGTETGTQLAALVGPYCLARRTAGYDAVILGTLPSREDGLLSDNYRSEYHGFVRDQSWQSTHGVTAVCDFAAIEEIGGNGAANNTTYFDADKSHLSSAGSDLMAAEFLSTLTTVTELLS